jgi:hypothetical protein
MYSCQLDWRSFGRRVIQLFRLEVIFPVLVVDFELRTFLFHQRPLGWVQLSKRLDTMRAVIVWTLMDGHFLL